MIDSSKEASAKVVESCPQLENQTQYPSARRLSIIIFALCCGTLLIAIDNTILAVAIPEITTDFQALEDVGWYGSAYLIAITASQPTFGNVYKYFNVKLTYLASIVLFEIGSTLCAAAPSSTVFIVGRAIAGLGAAGLFQGALGIVGFSVPLVKRPLYLGIVVSVFGFATCFGPVLGGAFTSHLTWRWCFWINLPIGVPSFMLVLIFLKLQGLDDEDRALSFKAKLQHMDLNGAFILISAICCLLLALQWGGLTQPWSSARIVGLFVGFALLTGVFALLQWKLGEKATVPLRFLRQRSTLFGAIYAFCLNASNYVDGYYLPFYFQAAQSVSAITSGIRFIPLALAEIVAIGLIGAVVSKTGHYISFMILAAVVGTVGTGLLSTIGLDTPTVQWAAYMVLTGLGIGMGIQLPYTVAQVIASDTDIPIANAIMAFFSQLGGAISVPIGSTILVNSLSTEVPRYAPEVPASAVIREGATNLRSLAMNASTLRAIQSAYVQSISHILYFSTGIIAVALPIAMGVEWRSTKKGPRVGTGDEKAHEAARPNSTDVKINEASS